MASYEQFTKIYENSNKFFELKEKYDPSYRWSNNLWDKYYEEYLSRKQTQNKFILSDEEKNNLEKEFPFYTTRKEGQSSLTLPEWYMVFSYNEFADFLKNNHKQQDFDFINSIKTFWKYYLISKKENKDQGFNFQYNVMVYTIGASFTIEYTIKYLYENTLGRATSFIVKNKTTEDIFMENSWERFAKSVYTTPWYKYNYFNDFKNIWTENDLFKKDFLRSFERKISLSVSYLIKSVYAMILGYGSNTAFGVEENKTLFIVSNFDLESIDTEFKYKIKILKVLDEKNKVYLVESPRYREFTEVAKEILRKGGHFVEIMNNKNIIISYISDTENEPFLYLYNFKILSKDKLWTGNTSRVILKTKFDNLDFVHKELQKQKIEIEHIYDY